MTDSPIAQLEQALSATEALVARVGPDQWSDPTPCGDWTVRELLNHLVAGNLLFARLLRGDSTPPPSAPGEADLLSNDPLGAYRNAADALLTALQRPEALAETVTLPFGQVSGVIAVHVRIVEVLVHGWDVAVATGQQPAMPQDLAEREIEFSVGLLEKLPPGRMPFAPPQPVPDDAPAMDRLVALLGRRV